MELLSAQIQKFIGMEFILKQAVSCIVVGKQCALIAANL